MKYAWIEYHRDQYPVRILCRVLGRSARELKLALEREGVLVRHYSSALLRDYIRVTAGAPAQSERLMEALERL